MKIMLFLLCLCTMAKAQELTFVELNCENLFDCQHDSLKNDLDFCEGGSYHWTKGRFWKKVNNIGREIISCGGEGENWRKPDLVALIEVENDSVLTWLTQRSCLKKAGYKYVMTNSPDARGIDVALLYDSTEFVVNECHSIRIPKFGEHKATRDILYVNLAPLNFPFKENYNIDCKSRDDASTNESITKASPLGRFGGAFFVVHLPSRAGGEKVTAPYRNFVSDILCHAIDSLRDVEPDANIIVAGDFNDYYTNQSVSQIEQHGMKNVSAHAVGLNGAQGTYRYQGEWGSLDQILISENLLNNSFSLPNASAEDQNSNREINTVDCHINDAPFLVIEDKKYGGVKPHRVYTGPRYDGDGFSDHLPLVLKLKL